ncbi:MAG: hypothetical protein U0703_29475 [Anaerolineae bacterium]
MSTLTHADPYNLGIKLLGTFGAPVAHPDDPDRAVDAALELTTYLAQYNHRLLEELPPERPPRAVRDPAHRRDARHHLRGRSRLEGAPRVRSWATRSIWRRGW